jgi:hypothetical protein
LPGGEQHGCESSGDRAHLKLCNFIFGHRNRDLPGELHHEEEEDELVCEQTTWSLLLHLNKEFQDMVSVVGIDPMGIINNLS